MTAADIPLAPLDEFIISVRGTPHVVGVYAGSATGYWLLVIQSGREEIVHYKDPPGRMEKVITYGPDPCGYGAFTKKRGVWWLESPGPAAEMLVLMVMRKWVESTSGKK